MKTPDHGDSKLIIDTNKNLSIKDIVPTIANYQKIISNYKKRINDGEFYEEPIGDDFFYPDW